METKQPHDARVARALAAARSGERLSLDDAAHLYRHADRESLAACANDLRQQRVPGDRATYLVDRNINYTNVCITDCLFCAFYRAPGDGEAYVNSREILGAKIRELVDVGGTRILMQGGHHPDLRLTWYVELLEWIRTTFPTIEIDAFSPSEIDHIATVESMSTRAVLERLREAGLAGLPGGGAEILDDDVRRRISPKKQSADGWLAVMEEAQDLGLATSASMVIGFGETLEQRLHHLDRLRLHQDRALAAHGNGFTAFIMWTAQIENTPLERSRHAETFTADREEYLKHLALCRLVLDNFDHIQASWPTMGPDVAGMALHHGADDYGSTMLEENVVSSAGTVLTKMDAIQIRRQIVAAGFTPAQRDTRYETLRVFSREEALEV